ncbi:STAS domain-containing protein [Streptomyces sp. NPDC005791]|jgi:anti-sigma B factor antagonist|uniref:STAS domain-containing protein n=1 Tax=unclassified Streptomyces TaxID=2593676 RepID=UPI00340348C4
MSTDDQQVSVTEEPDGRYAVATVTGELDVATAPAVYHQATEAIAHCPLVILDLSGVTFCDSSGFNALLRLRRRAQETGTDLALAAAPAQVVQLLTLSGAETAFPMFSSLAEAETHIPHHGNT